MSGTYPSRRRFLQALAGGSMAALAGCPGQQPDADDGSPPTPKVTSGSQGTRNEASTPDETRTRLEALETTYDRAVDVTTVGARPDGRTPINDVLESEAGDDTALFFPPGEYLMADLWRIEEFSNLAIVGEDAIVRPPEGYDAYLFGLGSRSGASGLRFEGMTFDFTAQDTGARPIHGMVSDGLVVRDVTVRGRQDVDQDSVRFDVTDPDGTGRVERLALPDGGDSRYANTGVYVGEASRGRLQFVDCHVAGWPDNGLYASPALGSVEVLGGRYENNGISSVRVGGDSLVRGVTVRCDSAREGLENMRGIRLREGRDTVVENVTVEMRQVTNSDGAITMAEWLESATVRNTLVRTEADGVQAVNAKTPSLDEDPEDDSFPIELEGVTITGTAADGAAVSVSNRSSCRFENLCVSQRGRNRNGIQLDDSRSNTLRHSTIAVTGEPLVLEDASIDRHQVSLARDGRRCR